MGYQALPGLGGLEKAMGEGRKTGSERSVGSKDVNRGSGKPSTGVLLKSSRGIGSGLDRCGIEGEEKFCR